MKKLITISALLLSTLAFSQGAQSDPVSGMRVMFTDGTLIHLLCASDNTCVTAKDSTSPMSVAGVNFGLKTSRSAYILRVK
jgi:hypothetical protein